MTGRESQILPADLQNKKALEEKIAGIENSGDLWRLIRRKYPGYPFLVSKGRVVYKPYEELLYGNKFFPDLRKASYCLIFRTFLEPLPVPYFLKIPKPVDQIMYEYDDKEKCFNRTIYSIYNDDGQVKRFRPKDWSRTLTFGWADSVEGDLMLEDRSGYTSIFPEQIPLHEMASKILMTGDEPTFQVEDTDIH